MTIKLSELKAARAGMSPGVWYAKCAESIDIRTADNGDDFDVADDLYPSDGHGIVATHNAVDVILEIVEAALDRDEARQALADARLAPMTRGYLEAVNAASEISAAADKRYLTAKSKVSR